jgi:hypothetical protein
VSADLVPLYPRLANWVRWSRTPQAQGRCAGLEGGWRPPPQYSDKHIAVTVDNLDAERVEHAWRSLGLAHRLLVKAEWIHELGRLHRRNRISRVRYEQRLASESGVPQGEVLPLLHAGEVALRRQLAETDALPAVERARSR